MTVLDHHALRLARRAGGVDHVSKIGSRDGRQGNAGLFAVLILVGLVEEEHTAVVAGEQGGVLGRGQREARRGVGADEALALLGHDGIDREVSGASLEHGQDRDDYFDAAVERDGDQFAALQAGVEQAPRQRAGQCIELGIAQATSVFGDGDGMRGVLRPFFEPAVQVRRRLGSGGMALGLSQFL
ncbi:hypothetical protein D3C85_590980 [compost metagenome]